MLETLYRRSFDAAMLLRDHPPEFRHPHKSALFELAYPSVDSARGLIEVTQWGQHAPKSLALPETLAAEVRPDFYDYRPGAAADVAVEWHVNFADPRLFVAYGSGLFAQDEMQVAEHPLLASVREALLASDLSAKTCDDSTSTPILVSNVERKLENLTNADASAGRPAGLYGNRFAAASLDVILRATRRVEPPTFTNLIAIAAPSGGRGDYTQSQIASIFATAYTGFAAARQETTRIAGAEAEAVVHSGFWGCGAFGGNRKLMIALQALAARAAGVARLFIHAGDEPGVADAERGLDVAVGLASRCGSPCALGKLVERVEMLGYRWGVSDGN
ncbi:MAG TPA: hypothetical protein VGE52_11135 [Pirellulales bacterium]